MVVQAPKETPQEIMSAMEAVMVNEFRVCQSLLTVLQEERQALVQKDVEALSKLVEQKESLLDELGSNEETRRSCMEKLAQKSNAQNDAMDLMGLLRNLQLTASERLYRLQEGITALQSKIRELNRANMALAQMNLERITALQEYLVSLFSSPSYYQPSATSAQTGLPPASYGMDQRG
ncbi:MAG: flagellar protein FlgN [Leptolinea sp.]|nr:flagellar protein FlgN [Leptolinea sp.]